MNRREFVIEALKKLQELKKEEEQIKDLIKGDEVKVEKQMKNASAQIIKLECELCDFLRHQKGVEIDKREVEVGHDRYPESVTEYCFKLFHSKIYDGDYGRAKLEAYFYPLPEQFLTLEGVKNTILSYKNFEKKDKIRSLSASLHEKKETREKIECEKKDVEEKIESYSKVKFLFKKKLETLKEQLASYTKEIEDLKKQEQEIEETIKAYKDLHVFVSDEQVSKLVAVYAEMDRRIRETNPKLEDLRKKELNYLRQINMHETISEENKKLKDNNEKALNKLMEALLTPELLDEVESYVSSEKSDKELLEVATKVLASGGRGKKRVTI